jgi:mannose-6-phosphate isomerase-like protein (cupin superfamily)
VTGSNRKNTADMALYEVGERVERPWGHYVVTGVGALPDGGDYCEKILTVMPGKVLSLQSHDLRAETWRVIEGVMTALSGNATVTLKAGEDITLPKGIIHCMANLGDVPCVFHERQEGVCREEDIHKYADAYGRETETPSEDAAKALSVYHALLEAAARAR